MTKKEIIEETVNYYQRNSRAALNETCYYLIDGKMCAVARCFTPAALVKYGDMGGVVGGLAGVMKDRGESFEDNLQERYRGHPIAFWSDLQPLHDRADHWNGNILTEEGKGYMNRMIKGWSNPDGSDKSAYSLFV